MLVPAAMAVLPAGPVAVSQLEAAAGEQGIARATLYRTAARLAIERTSTGAGKLWALLAEPAAVESEGPVSNDTPEEVEAAESEAAGIDPRVEQLVAAARRLMSRGVRREVIDHRVRKRWGAETADEVAAQIERLLERKDS